MHNFIQYQKKEMNVSMKKVSVVIPMYNEEEVANKSYTKIKDILENLKQYE